jgi:hypothetical protein
MKLEIEKKIKLKPVLEAGNIVEVYYEQLKQAYVFLIIRNPNIYDELFLVELNGLTYHNNKSKRIEELTEELSEYTYTVYSKDEYKLILSDK